MQMHRLRLPLQLQDRLVRLAGSKRYLRPGLSYGSFVRLLDVLEARIRLVFFVPGAKQVGFYSGFCFKNQRRKSEVSSTSSERQGTYYLLATMLPQLLYKQALVQALG